MKQSFSLVKQLNESVLTYKWWTLASLTCTPLFAFVPRRHYISLSEKSSLVFSSALRSDRLERHLVYWARSVGSSHGERTFELEVFHILDNVWKSLGPDFRTLNEGLIL